MCGLGCNQKRGDATKVSINSFQNVASSSQKKTESESVLFCFFFYGSPKNFLLIQGGLHFLRLRDLVTHWDRFCRESCGAPCRS